VIVSIFTVLLGVTAIFAAPTIFIEKEFALFLVIHLSVALLVALIIIIVRAAVF
jgi:hypothetical protein